MEKDFEPFAWGRIFVGEQPSGYVLEVAFKCVLTFSILLLIMRMMGKRGQATLSPMQQMLLIALGSAAGDVLLYPDVPLLYASIVLVGITGLTMGLERLCANSHRVRDRIESHPRILVRDGVIDIVAMKEERTTERELRGALRSAGARSLSQVQYAILEVDGEVSTFLNDTPSTTDDLIEPLLSTGRRKAGASFRHVR